MKTPRVQRIPAITAVGIVLLLALLGCRTIEKAGSASQPPSRTPDIPVAEKDDPEASPADRSSFQLSLPEMPIEQYRAVQERLPTARSKVLMCCYGCIDTCRDPGQACQKDTSCIELGRRTGHIKRHCLGMVPEFESMSAGDCADFLRAMKP